MGKANPCHLSFSLRRFSLLYDFHFCKIKHTYIVAKQFVLPMTLVRPFTTMSKCYVWNEKLLALVREVVTTWQMWHIWIVIFSRYVSAPSLVLLIFLYWVLYERLDNFLHNIGDKQHWWQTLYFLKVWKKSKKNMKIKNEFFIIETNEKGNCSQL